MVAPNVLKYLNRIGYRNKIELNFDCLSRLQSCHQSSVPYENLSCFLGDAKILDIDILFKRIVVEKRGGWCHELNGLFAWLLREIGFQVKIVSSNHYDRKKKQFSDEPYSHIALLVELDNNQFLVDVGYGFPNQHFQPLQIATEIEYTQVRRFKQSSHIFELKCSRLIILLSFFRSVGITDFCTKRTMMQ